VSKNQGEPSLETIDDYNGTETKQKRNTIRWIVLSLLLIGAVLSYMQQPFLEEAVQIQEQTSIPAK